MISKKSSAILNICRTKNYKISREKYKEMTFRFPYTTASEFDCLAAIIEHDPPQLKIEDGFAPDLSDFITYILNKNVNERPNYPQILVSLERNQRKTR